METQTLLIHRDAPDKPAYGDPCNHCGICCASETCPAGWIIFRRRTGPCPALTWQNERYTCGLASAPRQHLPWLPESFQGIASRLFQRWIAAGKGCDSTAVLED